MIGRPSPPRRQAPPAPMVSAAQRQREVARMLMRLDDMLKKCADLAAAARERVSVGGMGRYRKFSRKVRDFFSLAAVTQERLDAAPSEMEELIGPMTTALERLHARMVILFVEESLGFFNTFARVKALPIGTHETVGVEFRALMEIRKFLDDPLYEGERGQGLRKQTDRVAVLMRAVMDRCPPLPDFGDEPSIGPRGTVNKPLRPPRAAPPAAAGRGAEPRPLPQPNSQQPDPRLEVRQLSLDDED